MGVTVNLINDADTIDTSKDNVVIVDVFATVRGGRSLDVTGYTPTVLKAGHVIIVETATGNHKPMPVTANAYAALPANHTYAGILAASILTKRPFAGILTQGTVNPACAPYPMTTILADVKTALPLIDFRQD